MNVQEQSCELMTRLSEKYGLDEQTLLDTLVQTAFKQQNGQVPTREQLLSLLAVADRYDLDLFSRQIWALSDRRNGVIPVISIDGWSRIMNTHPQSNGVSFAYPDELVTLDELMKPAHPWVECNIHRKDREHPICVREYLDELYRPAAVKNGRTFPGPWQTCPKRMLRHKSLVQAIRIGYGLSGVFDPDEAERILEGQLAEGGGVEVPMIPLNEEAPEQPLTSVKPATSAKAAPVKGEKVPAQPEPQPVVEAESGEKPVQEVSEPKTIVAQAPNAEGIHAKVLDFVDQLVKRASESGAFAAAQELVKKRLGQDANALDYCLYRLDQAEAELATAQQAA